ncbi:MAG: transposase [bacterium]|nr:transposase [bacterium]
MKQVARELTNCDDGFPNGKKKLIMDRDGKFSESFRSFLDDEGVKPIRLPTRSPNLCAYMERFMLSLKSECLDKLILFGERSLRNAVRQYLAHYHMERPHQGLGNQLITPTDDAIDATAEVESTERLGGLFRSNRRAA